MSEGILLRVRISPVACRPAQPSNTHGLSPLTLPCLASAHSLVFLVTSWLEARKVDGNSDWASFFNGKAVTNRLKFQAELTALLDAQRSGDGLAYLEKLYALSSRLRRPCLRLRILQQVLGLDTRFSRDTVHGVICLAFDVLEEMSGRKRKHGASVPETRAGGASSGAPAAPGATSLASFPSTTRQTSGLDLDEYDEATKLEADALLGTASEHARPSDPVGEKGRLCRIQYHYR